MSKFSASTIGLGAAVISMGQCWWIWNGGSPSIFYQIANPRRWRKWLRAHPTVQVISRDRAGAYAEGARQGAPGAVQVADRFHLFCNLTQALQRVLERLAIVLCQVKLAERSGPPSEPTEEVVSGEETPLTGNNVASEAPINKLERKRQQAREDRKALFDAVRAAHQRGLTKQAIAREFGLAPLTIRRYLQAKDFPERAPRQRRSELDSFRPYLEKRWAEGCHNASQLCRELRQQGYSGKRSRMKEYVQPWRSNSSSPSSRPRRTLPNLRLVALWLTKSPKQRRSDEQRWVDAVTIAHPQVGAAEHLAQQFRQVFNDHDSEALKSWLAKTVASDIPELKGFVAGVERDYDAVVAAVEWHWSNGQVEGQIHRLKLLKRQMYGRSGFELLRRRVLPFRTDVSQRPP